MISCLPGGNDRARTDDPLRVKQVLSLLSYASNYHISLIMISVFDSKINR